MVIPEDLREKHGLKPGTVVELVDNGGQIAIVPVPDDSTDALFGVFASHGERSWTEELLEEHRREREREDRRCIG